jgi:hypothetical protein
MDKSRTHIAQYLMLVALLIPLTGFSYNYCPSQTSHFNFNPNATTPSQHYTLAKNQGRQWITIHSPTSRPMRQIDKTRPPITEIHDVTVQSILKRITGKLVCKYYTVGAGDNMVWLQPSSNYTAYISTGAQSEKYEQNGSDYSCKGLKNECNFYFPY